MVFIRKYVFLLLEILLLYLAAISSTLFRIHFVNVFLFFFLLFYYFVRVIDDLKDYKFDFLKHTACIPFKALVVMAIFLFLGCNVLIIYSQLWFCYFLFAFVLLFASCKPIAIFAKLCLLPCSYSLLIYYYDQFGLWQIVILILFSFLSLLYAIYKSISKEFFYESYKALSSIGGKAYHLIEMQMPNTPEFFSIPYEFFLKCEIDPKEKEKLLAKINRFCRKKELYAVRSSAIDEDSSSCSFAGIHKTKLNVKKDDVFKAIFEVYESAFSPLALHYREMNHLSVEEIRMAVVVQKMVEDPDYAGVIFTMNPKTDNPDEFCISVIDGLGEDLVNGNKDSKDYIVSKDTFNGDFSFISKKIIQDLYSFGLQCQKKMDAFLDIEFAIKKQKIYFLQARKITTYSDIQPSLRIRLIDNSNLIESYYGTVLPLTQSFAKSIYEGVYTKTLEAGHVRKKIMNALEPTLKSMLFEYEGKLYYNLNSWYHLTSIFPVKSSTRYMEQMMGVSTGTENQKKIKLSILDMIKIGCCFIFRLKTMEKYSVRFIEKFNRIVLPFYGKELTGSTEQLIQLYHQIEENILSDFATPILNDCAVMFYNGRLTRRINKKFKDDFSSLYASCIHSNKEMESAQMIDDFLQIVNYIKNDSALFKDFEEETEEYLYEKYHHKGDFFSQLLHDYILHFGSRVMNELKLETITMIENPLLLYKQIKSGLKKNQVEEMVQSLVEIPSSLHHLAKKTRYYIVNRERLRLKRTYIFSVVRNIFLAIGKNFEREGKLESFRDIFYLKKEEIFSEIEKPKELIILRKEEYKKYDSSPYYSRVSFYPNRILPVKVENNHHLTGICTGKKIVKGQVSVMKHVTDPFTIGSIIVAPRTDPGWISLFPLASGLIVEHGSMLSHSFVVAREMGLPAVVGIPNITNSLKSGDCVILDSITGVVTIEK